MSSWTLAYHGFEPRAEMHREALCALGNGLFCTRGAAEWADADGDVHYPGTYVAGGYNRLVTEISGRDVENEDLVNMANWLPLRVRIDGGDWLRPDDLEIVDYLQELDLRAGMLRRTITVRDEEGRETTLLTRRIVHMGSPHLAANELTVTPGNWSGRLEICSALDGSVVNAGVKRYRDLASLHLLPLESFVDDGVQVLVTTTNQSRLLAAQAARTQVFRDGRELDPLVETEIRDDYVAQRLLFDASEDAPVRIEKVIALYTARDPAISTPALEARDAARRAGSFGELADSHARAWDRLWRRCDIQVENVSFGDEFPSERVQLIIRLHVFHLLQTVSRNSVGLDVGVPARGWHGEAYRGHIFWDELFILPFLDLRLPEVTKAMLQYRHRRLERAREAAAAAGYRGAMYPWQSGSNGTEETQVMHLNPHSGRWLPDGSHRQRHVNAAIVYNTWIHYQVTRDYEFMHVYGAEMILEIARFWGSIASYSSERDRYEIRGVMGPDEFHEGYPDTEEPGLDNNAYTNVMAAWCADVALQTLDLLLEDRRNELVDLLGISDDEIATWTDMRHKMFVPFHDDGIISQFEGYEKLREFDWVGYMERYGDISRLDRILESEGDSPKQYKVSKQADVLMLIYLFSDRSLGEILGRLGYEVDDDLWRRNYDYYSARTSHGSTLSQIVHAVLAARFTPGGFAREFYATALRSDVDDIQRGTTREGVHIGAMAASVDVLTRRFLGFEIRDGALVLNPAELDGDAHLAFRMRFMNTWLDVSASGSEITIASRPGGRESIRIAIDDTVHHLRSGQRRTFRL